MTEFHVFYLTKWNLSAFDILYTIVLERFIVCRGYNWYLCIMLILPHLLYLTVHSVCQHIEQMEFSNLWKVQVSRSSSFSSTQSMEAETAVILVTMLEISATTMFASQTREGLWHMSDKHNYPMNSWSSDHCVNML